jgi:hypothetical protein
VKRTPDPGKCSLLIGKELLDPLNTPDKPLSVSQSTDPLLERSANANREVSTSELLNRRGKLLPSSLQSAEIFLSRIEPLKKLPIRRIKSRIFGSERLIIGKAIEEREMIRWIKQSDMV